MTAVLRLLSRRGEPSRRLRRTAVVAGAAGIAGSVALFTALPGEAALLAYGVWALLLVPLAVISEFRRNVFRRKDVDERERLRRNDAYRLSYRVIEFVVAFLPLAFIVVPGIDAIARRELFAVWFLTFNVVIWLPPMVFAWREPDAAPD